MKELELTIRIKNNRLLERREALGLSQNVMADVVGIYRHRYADLENLRCSAAREGEWTPEALQVAEYFDCDPSEALPRVPGSGARAGARAQGRRSGPGSPGIVGSV